VTWPFPALILAALVAAAPASACEIATATTTRWSIVSDHGVEWLKTPCGERFYSLGVNALDGGYPWREHDGKIWYSWTAFAPSLADWVNETMARLKQCRRNGCRCRRSSTWNWAGMPNSTGSTRSTRRSRRG
jgi:hypothetical protein